VIIDGLVMAYVFALGVAIAHVLNPRRDIYVWQALLAGLAIVSVIPIAIFIGLRRPIDRLTPLDPLPRMASPPEASAAEPRLSRLAIIGAIWACIGLLGLSLIA